MNYPDREEIGKTGENLPPLRDRLNALLDQYASPKESNSVPMPSEYELWKNDGRLKKILETMVGNELLDIRGELQNLHVRIQAYVAKCVSEGRGEISDIVEKWQTFIELLDENIFDEVEAAKDDLFPIIESLKEQLQSALDTLPTRSMIHHFSRKMLDVATTPMIKPSPTGSPYHPGSRAFRGVLYTYCLIGGLIRYQLGADLRKADIDYDQRLTQDPTQQGFRTGITDWNRVTESTNSAATFYRYARDEFHRNFSAEWCKIDDSAMTDAQREKAIKDLTYKVKVDFLESKTPGRFNRLPARYGNPTIWLDDGTVKQEGTNAGFFRSIQSPVEYGNTKLHPTNFYELYLDLEPIVPERKTR